jgi:hypothetical protein
MRCLLFVETFTVAILLCFKIKPIEANQISIVYPTKVNQTLINELSHGYAFTPFATIIGLVFIGVSFSFLAIAKILYASSDQYMTNNRFDLVIFKPPTNKIVFDRIYTNTTTNSHNLAAAKACGFDVSMLRTRNLFTTLINRKSTKRKDPKAAMTFKNE